MSWKSKKLLAITIQLYVTVNAAPAIELMKHSTGRTFFLAPSPVARTVHQWFLSLRFLFFRLGVGSCLGSGTCASRVTSVIKSLAAAVGFHLMLATVATAANPSRPGVDAKFAQPQERWEITKKGPHSQVVRWLRPLLDPEGHWSVVTNQFVQMETGLNYLSAAGLWEPSRCEIEVSDQGGAMAGRGQHKVWFSGQFNTGSSIEMTMPDGQRLVSHVQGLAYYDSAQDKSVMIAEVHDSEAWLYPPNQILYPDAFESVEADVRYTYTKSGLEQDIILREAPPSPEKFGMNPDTTRLEVWTEFIHPPEPRRVSHRVAATSTGGATGSVWDEELNFGAMHIGCGKTFLVGNDEKNLAQISRQWMANGERRFLVEAVQLPEIQTSLEILPPARGGAGVLPAVRSRLEAMQSMPVHIREGSRTDVAVHRMTPSLMAQVDRKPGLVLDYQAVNGTLTNVSFQSDTTYFVSGTAVLSGTNTTFEGGTVLKYSRTNAPKVVVNSPVTWLGDIYQPVVLTAADDSSVGHPISTNSPTGYYADTALDLEAGTANSTFSLQHLRVSYARTAITLNQRAGHVLSHLQLVNCQTGISPLASDFSLRNALFVNVLTNFNGMGSTGRVEHLTVDGASWLNANTTFATANLRMTNSLLVAVNNLGGMTATSVSIVTNNSGVFQSVGGGNHYLALGSPYRDVGVPLIHSNLSSDFKKCTTYPPLIWTNPIVVNSSLTPVIPRDDDVPDLGYHYPAMDYYLPVPLTVSNGVLTLGNGVTLGFSEASCIWLQSRSSLVSTGFAQAMNVISRSSAVYESVPLGFHIPSGSDVIVNSYEGTIDPATAPTVTMSFTALYMNAPNGYSFYNDFVGFHLSSLRLRDCQIFGGYLSMFGASSPLASNTVFSCNNNLLYRNWWDIEGPIQFSFFNHLGVNSLLYFFAGSSDGSWVVRDNQFDGCDVLADETKLLSYSNNAYSRTNGLSVLLPLQPSDIVLPSFSFVAATNGLGRWYQGQANMVNAGSRTADLAGLYHETTQPTQGKELGTKVDIGFHYVAQTSAGNPSDGDGDGIADYLEDSNGNGRIDTGETSWNSSTDLGFRIWIASPLGMAFSQ